MWNIHSVYWISKPYPIILFNNLNFLSFGLDSCVKKQRLSKYIHLNKINNSKNKYIFLACPMKNNKLIKLLIPSFTMLKFSTLVRYILICGILNLFSDILLLLLCKIYHFLIFTKFQSYFILCKIFFPNSNKNL